MDLNQLDNQTKIFTLQQAAEELSVTIDTLLQWNDFNILKPTITKSGEVVYTQKQIDKFQQIHQTLRSNKVPTEQVPDMNKVAFPVPPAEVPAQTESNSHNHFPVGLTLLFAGLVAAAILSTYIPHNPLISQMQSSSQDKAVALQINKPGYSDSAPLSEKVELANNHLNDSQPAGTDIDKSTDANMQNKIDSGIGNIGYSEIANATANSDSSHSLFDESGNIKGENTAKDVMGMALGMTKNLQSDNTVKTVTNPNILFTFVILSTAAIIFILKKQFAYSVPGDMLATPVNFTDSPDYQRVLEVDQKMDGTVVLYLQGKEHKLCKPELDSESDQFIERLMELSHPDQKEIDYDKSFDENVRLTTPLSKLVTRLGFVGVKRNLFFPRTSKNKVLFRRFITKSDLASMKLNINDVSKEFIQS